MEEFNNYFELIVADTENLRNTAYKLRYKILVDEYEFKLSGNPYTLTDEDRYDKSACLCLVKYKHTNEFVATMRIVYPAAINEYRLPFEQYCKLFGGVTWDRPGRKNIVEVSRISISKTFKQLLKSDTEIYKVANRLSTVMFACAISIAQQLNRDYIVGTVSPAWSRTIKKAGFEHHQMGPSVDHDGFRYPIIVCVKQILASAKINNPELYNLLCGNIVKFPKVAPPLN